MRSDTPYRTDKLTNKKTFTNTTSWKVMNKNNQFTELILEMIMILAKLESSHELRHGLENKVHTKFINLYFQFPTFCGSNLPLGFIVDYFLGACAQSDQTERREK